MIDGIINYSIKNRVLIVLVFIAIVVWGIFSVFNVPLDAIPDLSENQVIVMTAWPGRGPKIIEDQVTFPLSQRLLGLPKTKTVRALSMFGVSMIYVIFQDSADIYWARTRVLEQLNASQGMLPMGVMPMLGPDGTGIGHIFWYTLKSDKYDLGSLRTFQDWYVRYMLSSVRGVAEVASIGGFVKQYQVDLDPNKLLAYKVTPSAVLSAIEMSNRDVAGRLIETQDMEYIIRGLGYIQTRKELEDIVVGGTGIGAPIYIKNLGTVQVGADIRRGLLEEDGEGEVVGGIIVMRYGENADRVIRDVKKRMEKVKEALPSGITIDYLYDRSELIEESIDTLKHTLIEEGIIVSLVVIIFLFHFGSALTIIITLPIAVLMSFIVMSMLRVTSNIMSLGGIAISIGVLIDASIALVENAYRHLTERAGITDIERVDTIRKACLQVGRSIFFSLVIIVISFAPIFLLTEQEGKLFRPLAYTKTFSMAAAAIIAITLTPVLMIFFMRGKMVREERNPATRFLNFIYSPVLRLAMKYRWVTIGLALALLITGARVAMTIGSEFMPPLDEGKILYMPTTLPSISISEVKRIVTLQNQIIRKMPEVESVLGKVGRAETATDPAPISMVETIINLKPRSQWRRGIKKADIVAELDEKLKIPGVVNGWTQPIINRVNMLATGIRTDLGVKVYGSDLKKLDELTLHAEAMLKNINGARDVYAERIGGAIYADIKVNRGNAARYGVMVGDVQEVIEMILGGEPVTTTIQGRERYQVRARFIRGVRDDISKLSRIFVPTMMKSYVPLTQVADIKLVEGPAMIWSEKTLPRGVVILNVRGRDMGSFVGEAEKILKKELKPLLPSGYYYEWAGQWENQKRAKRVLSILVPAAVLSIIVLLYFAFGSWIDALLLLFPVPTVLVGAVLLQKMLHYNFSVAVWVGYIAIFGIAVETGVLMHIYLSEALDARIRRGNVTLQDIKDATFEGAALRLRPKMMTVMAALAGLIPIMWSTGTGSDLMRPIAVPLIGGLVSSSFHVLLVIPVLFQIYKEIEWKGGKLKESHVHH